MHDDHQLSPVLRHLRRLASPSALDEITDGELLQRFTTERTESAFRALLSRHGSMVLGVCQRVLRHSHAAEDAFQATFLLLARNAASIRERESVGSWLHGVAHRTALKARTQELRRRTREQRVATRLDDEPNHQTAWRELQAVLDDELNQLPSKYRRPLILCYLEGKTHQETAHDLGLPLGTVKSLLARGRERLRTRLMRRGMTLSATALGTTLVANQAIATVTPALIQSTLKATVGTVPPAVADLAAGGTVSVVAAKMRAGLATLLLLGIVGGTSWLILPGAPAPLTSPSPEPLVVLPEQPAGPAAADALPPNAKLRLGNLRLRHKDGIAGVAFSHDGKFLATAGDDQVLRIWDSVKGHEWHAIRDKNSSFRSLTFVPNGATLAWVSGKGIHLWDAAKSEERALLAWEPGTAPEGKLGEVGPLAFAADGATVAVAMPDHSVRLWDVVSGKIRRSLAKQEQPLGLLAFGVDGKTLVAATRPTSGSTILHWDLASGDVARKHVLPPPAGQRLRPMALSQDGATLAAEITKTVRRPQGTGFVVYTEYRVVLLDTAKGKERLAVEGQADVIWSAAFSPDGKTIAWNGMDYQGGLAKVATGEILHRLAGHPGSSRPDGRSTLAFSGDGKTLAAVGSSAAIQLWDVTTGKELLATENGHAGAITALAFSDDGHTLISGSSDHTIRLWDAPTGRPLHRLDGHQDGISAFALAPDGKTLAASSRDGVIRLWNIDDGRELGAIQALERTAGTYFGLWPLAFAPDGRTLVSWGDDQQLRVWDKTSLKELSRQPIQLQEGTSLPTGRPTRRLESIAEIACVKFSTDSRTAALARDDSIHVVDTTSGRERHRLAGHSGPSCLAFSRDGRLLASGGWDKIVRIGEVATGKERLKIEGLGIVNAVALAPDGLSVAVACGWTDATIDIFDTTTGKRRRRFEGHGAYVGALAFSPDGKRLASGQRDTTVLIWDVTSP